MRKILTVFLALICVGLGGYYYWIEMHEDHTPPIIYFPQDSDDFIYHEGDDKEVLLQGVLAVDAVDGDVTDSLVIDAVFPMQDETKATVLYFAKDSSDNMIRKERVVEYRPEGGIDWIEAAQRREKEEAKKESAQEEETESEENEIDDNNLPADYPRIYLKTNAVTVKYGEEYNLLSYVKDITDTEDGPDWLYSMIHIEGMYDINGPGVYDLYYTVVDREGHLSNRAKLVLTVE